MNNNYSNPKPVNEDRLRTSELERSYLTKRDQDNQNEREEYDDFDDVFDDALTGPLLFGIGYIGFVYLFLNSFSD